MAMRYEEIQKVVDDTLNELGGKLSSRPHIRKKELVPAYVMDAASKSLPDETVVADIRWALLDEGEPSMPGRKLKNAFERVPKEGDQ